MTTSDVTNGDDPRRLALRRLIAADLRAVRPLRRPWLRAAILGALGVCLLVLLPLVLFHVRTDVDRLSPLVTWGASVLQIGVALAIAVFACGQVVPGRWAPPRASVARLALGCAAVVSVMAVTWWASAVRMPAGYGLKGAYACFLQSTINGLPLLALGLFLAARGLPGRPALVGGLVGLSAGVMADASWRMVCVVTEPSHVLTGHLGAVLAPALAGSLLLWTWARLQLRGRPRP